jgi:SAM-dependent methyltransferase
MDNTTAADYDQSLNQHGESPKALHWANYSIPAIRFRELVKDVPVEGKSVFDAGCGMGDLLPFLYAKSENFKYLGMDTKPEFIEIASKRYEGHDFKTGDAINEDVGKFDVVICSGVLNGNVENWMEKRKKAILKLYDKADEVLAFNMSGSVNQIQNTEITAFADMKEVFEFCSSLTPNLIIRAHYSNRGFSVILFK